MSKHENFIVHALFHTEGRMTKTPVGTKFFHSMMKARVGQVGTGFGRVYVNEDEVPLRHTDGPQDVRRVKSCTLKLSKKARLAIKCI